MPLHMENYGNAWSQISIYWVNSVIVAGVTKATTALSTNFPAQYGVSAGGTSYMIPATAKGDNLTYAIKFL